MSLADYDNVIPAEMPGRRPTFVRLDGIDYANPTHVPYMVAAAMIDCSGVEVEYIEDVDYFALCVAALDAMPGGREAVVRAVVREWGYIPKDGEGEG